MLFEIKMLLLRPYNIRTLNVCIFLKVLSKVSVAQFAEGTVEHSISFVLLLLFRNCNIMSEG